MDRRLSYGILALAILGLAGATSAEDLGKGNILFEWFDGTTGGNLDQFVDGRNWTYPDNPSSSAWRTSFEGPEARGDYYGTHVRGYLHPPADGDYTFWVASDDHSRVWLSTDENPANKALICEIVGYSGATEWTKYATQKSNPVALKAGRKYYIEALHRDGSGGDRLRVAWGGPTIGDGPVIIAGTYLSPWIRRADLIASTPSPANGDAGVTFSLMTWNKGITAIWHNLYFGTEPDPPFLMQMPAAAASGLYFHLPGFEPGVTYYWRVDEVELDGTTIHTGDLWTFQAASIAARGPTPPDDARGVFTDVTLEWGAGKGAIQHEIYFDANEADVAAGAAGTFQGQQVATSLIPGGLKNDTTYYWRVDEIDAAGVKTPGKVWKFRTLPPQTVTDPNLLGWWKLDEVMGTAVDYSGHGYHGELRGGAQPAIGMIGGAIELDGMNDFVYLGKNAGDLGIEGAKPKSVSAWVYTHSFHDGGIFDMGARVSSQDFCLRARAGNNQWRVQYYSVDHDFTYTSLNTWVHFVLTYDGAQSTCYANGAVVSTAARTLNTAVTNPFQIGGYGWPGNFFDGLIDDVRLYNKALSAAEVQVIYSRADPLQAWNAGPSLGAVTDALQAIPLTWAPGDTAVKHDVYLSTDPNIIRDGDASDTTGGYRGRGDANSYTPDPVLQWGARYFWRVDEVAADGSITEGRTWNFTITDWLIVDDFESYANGSPNRIFQTWLDSYGYSADEFFAKGYDGNGTGAGVGHDIWTADSTYLNGSIAERGHRHGGAQSMPLYYDNTADPFYSETERSWASSQDWTIEGVDGLILHVRGIPRKFVPTGPDSMSLSAAGVDIWGNADQFRYACKTLTGDGSIIACVDSNGFGTNRWAKGGVMIRATNVPGSVNAFATATGGDGGGFSFQWRPIADAASSSSNTPNPRLWVPTWVKLERVGDNFSGYYSRDGGATWIQQGTTQIIPMTDPVMIGIAVTSHAANQVRAFEFSHISTTGKVTGNWTVEEIGIAQRSNEDAMPLYVMVQDSSNRNKVVVHPDANILLSQDWSEWRIPLSDFSGVNMKAVKKMLIGVGDRKTPQAGGAGMVYIDNIGLTRPAPAAEQP